MNQNFKKVLDLISEMKESFSKKEKMKFDQATLTDGTVIEYEALEVGQAVFVVAEGEMIPAPEGTHSLSGELEGVSIIVDANGVITEIVDERQASAEEASAETESTETTTEAEPVAESMSAEDVEKIITAKLESFTAIIEGLGEMTKSIAENNATLVNELSSLKSEFEAFKAQPSVETREGEKFSKVGNLTTRQQFLLKSKNK